MRQIHWVFIFVLIASIKSHSQSKYGFDTGLDTIALNHRVKTKTKFLIDVDSSTQDTTRVETWQYLDNGYLGRYEQSEFGRKDRARWIEFKYNEQGYLIDEDWMWGGPLGMKVWADTTLTLQSTERTYIKGILRKELIIDSEISEGSDTTLIYHFTDTTVKYFNEQGILTKVDNRYVTEHYNYLENGLLREVDFENWRGVFRKEVFWYEYYE